MDQARARKLADRIAQIVAEMLERRIKDPRLGFVTITDARVTGDLREATVFYTVYGTDEERTGTAAALASATGVIRSEVGRQTGLQAHPVPDVRSRTRSRRAPGTSRSWWRGPARRTPRLAAGPRGRRAGRRPGPVPEPAGRRDDDDEDDDDAAGDDAGRPAIFRRNARPPPSTARDTRRRDLSAGRQPRPRPSAATLALP